MLVRIAIVLVTAVGALLGVSTSAFAVGCTSYHCDGEGPVSQHCDDDASLHATVSKYIGPYGKATAEMFYSPACRAFWTRGRSMNSDTAHGADYQVRIEKRFISDNSLIHSYTVTIPANKEGGSVSRYYDWTPMLGRYSGRKVRACIGYGGSYSCTAYVSN